MAPTPSPSPASASSSASSSPEMTTMPSAEQAASAFRERFHQVYQELIASGQNEVDSAARALLVAGGQTEDGTVSAPTNSQPPAATGAFAASTSVTQAPARVAPATAAVTTGVAVATAAAESQQPQAGASTEVVAARAAQKPAAAITNEAIHGNSSTLTPPLRSAAAAGKTEAPPSSTSNAGNMPLDERHSNRAKMAQEQPQEVKNVDVKSRPQQPIELITTEGISELIEIARATKDGAFRELIRFLGRTLSNPRCVGASFALRRRASLAAGAGVVRDGGAEFGSPMNLARVYAAGKESAAVPSVIKAAERIVLAVNSSSSNSSGGKGEEHRRSRGSSACRSSDPDEKTSGSFEGVITATTATPVEETAPTSTIEEEQEEKGKEDRSDGYGVKSDSGEEMLPSEEWADRSPVAVNIKAVAEAWRVLRELDVEGVSGAVLNALELLTQTLLVEKVLDRRGGDGDRVTPTSTSSLSGVAGDGDGDSGGGDSGGGPSDLRALVLILEHPEVQDPDFEGVLNNLFKLTTRLSEKSKKDLRSFLVGLEADRFSRYLGAVQQFISLRLYSEAGASSVIVAVYFVHVLYSANQEDRKVPDEMFYNEAVNVELFTHRPSLIGEYSRWRDDHAETNPSRYKSLISFGEVLDPASKAAVLSIDSQVQMRGMINSELQEAVMSGGFAEGGLAVMPYLLLRVRRSNIVEDSLQALVVVSDEDLKKPLKVHFVGEEGVDEGGVQKEYFQVMLRELLNPQFAMLKYDEENRSLWFNSDSLEAQEEFELVGMLLGIAIYNGIILDVQFPSVVYKLLMGKDPTLQDLKDAQPSLGRGLQQLLDFDGDVESTFERRFQISYEVFGAVKTFDLKEEGGELAVTKGNRQEYVDLYVHWLLVKSVEEQYGPFERGFHKVVGGKALRLFRPEELELLICGNPQLDFLALERNSKYEDGYKRDTPVIKNFWEVVHAFEEDSKRKLLKFATGSDRAPIQGLGSSGLSLVISKNGHDSDRLPTAHTCFNHLLLPAYATKEKLEDRLRLAIEQSEGFGLR